jgi:predicted porin
MNKKLLAVAVAGALAAPAAFAQSSVTISGTLKGGFESLKLGSYARAAGNASQTGVVDDSSAIRFNVVEDLGGGLQAIAQVDMRLGLDTGALAASGNTHLGLRSKNWGRIFFGRQDLHYFNTESDMATKGSLRSNPVSLLAYAGAYGAPGTAINGGTPIANATRTTNVIHYTTPNWGGFTMIVAYSANPNAAEADIASGVRKGSAWNLNPNFAGKDWQVGYSYWRAKPDGAGAAGGTYQTAGGVATLVHDQRGDRLYGSYRWGGFKIGLAWDKSKLKSYAAANAGTVLSDRRVWSIPMSYTWGPHSIHAHFDRARHDRAAGAAGLDTKANMFAVSYAYDLSKRTSAALTYARINNGRNAGYTFFTSGALGLGGGAGGVVAGEDPRMWGVTMRHAF